MKAWEQDVGWEPPPQIGEYRLVRPLGHGSMGQVFLGHDSVLDRDVAVKFLARGQPEPQQRERFLLEARAIARLQHSNVVSIYRVGEVEGRPYIVSEFVRGRSLDRFALPLAAERVVEIARALARGLAAVHRSGIIHRDIKPANIMLTEEGEVKLLDFGLARLVDTLPSSLADPLDSHALQRALSLSLAASAPAPSLTGTGALLGTPLYMAPELWAGQRATVRSDLYALGAVLYELCTGALPHEAPTLAALQQRAQGADVPPLAPRCPGADREFCAWVDRCLRRDPAERPESAEALGAALERLRPALTESLGGPAGEQTPARRWRWPWWVGAALLPAAGLLAGLRALRPTAPGSAPASLAEARPRMIPIAAGTFQMGSPEDEGGRDPDEQTHPVRLSRPFLLAETEVTSGQYSRVMGGPPRGRPELPAVMVSWLEAVTYCNRLSRLEGTEECYAILGEQVAWPSGLRCAGYRLPTEAEWEYAARGGERWILAGANDPSEIAWLAANTQELRPVRQRRPNGYGLYDLSGNAWEWVWDAYAPYPAGPATDPTGPALGAARVNRGGGWIDDARQLRVANRSRNDPGTQMVMLGFRVARTAP